MEVGGLLCGGRWEVTVRWKVVRMVSSSCRLDHSSLLSCGVVCIVHLLDVQMLTQLLSFSF